jgi:DNA polymerase III beta subunit
MSQPTQPYTFTVPTPDILSRALKTTNPIIQKNNPIEILRGVLVEIGPDGCTITGTDLEQTVQVRVPEIQSDTVEGDSGGTFSFVLFPRTVDMIHRLPDTKINFEFDPGTQVLHIRYGASEQRHSTLPAEDYPRVPEVEGALFSMAGVSWRRVAFAVDIKEPRLAFTGVYVDFKNRKLVGTDTRRLAMLDLGDILSNLGDAAAKVKGIILSLKAVNFISQLKGDVTLTVAESGHQVKVQAGDVTLYSRLILGEYPKYQVITDPHSGDNATVRVVVKVDELVDAVQRAGFVSVKDDILTFEFTDTGIKITGQGIEGTVNEVVACELFNGEGRLTTGFNWKFLLDCLKHVEADKVFWGLHDRQGPSVFRGIGDGDKGGGGVSNKDDKWLGILVPAVPRGM